MDILKKWHSNIIISQYYNNRPPSSLFAEPLQFTIESSSLPRGPAKAQTFPKSRKDQLQTT